MVSKEQIEQEKSLREIIDQMKKNLSESIIGMMNPVFVSCNSEEKSMSVMFTTKPWMRNPVGILHGGITAAMLDNAMGMLVRYYNSGHLAPTVNMSVDYIRQIPINEPIVVKGYIVSCGATLIRARGEGKISGKSGIVASGVATYYAAGF